MRRRGREGLCGALVAFMLLLPLDARAHDPTLHLEAADYPRLVARWERLRTKDTARISQVHVNGRPTLLAFMDRNCTPCLSMVPVVEDLKKVLEGRADIHVIDPEGEDPATRTLLAKFKVWAGPQFVLLTWEGGMAGKLFGPQPQEKLLRRLERLIEDKRASP